MFSDPKWPLEVEFGCFAAVGGPPGSGWAHEMLLRVDIGAARGRCAKNLQVYAVIPDTDLYRSVSCDQRLLSALPSISMSCCTLISDRSVPDLLSDIRHKPPCESTVSQSVCFYVSTQRSSLHGRSGLH